MVALVQPRLVNGPSGDSTLYLDFAFGRRAMLFDLGDIHALSPREVGRITHVFVSHLHMDHFAGFDRLLRLRLNTPGVVRLVGPPGLGEAVAHKLAAYRWNLLGDTSPDFALEALDWREGGFVATALFRARDGFVGRASTLPDLPTGLVWQEAGLVVEAVELDHGIPSLAFALQERLRVNVHKVQLDEMGLAVGPWLSRAKERLRAGESGAVEGPDGQTLSLETLVQAGALQTADGQRIAYVTDAGWIEANRQRIRTIAQDADTLFIEAGFLDADREIANGRQHLTAAQAGSLAREAGARRAVPHHFSPRYETREEELTAEFEAAYRRSGEA
ncbi:ribonuclease Z [Aureimonas sp. D3]|uniref:ribonuclease Z n=1 Tax=Aureimonas sp. D3 TaxID=1638164 RepID=UPI000781EC55|nr:MBL fold metallo-hydrolase [Aureimonas sp. D3]